MCSWLSRSALSAHTRAEISRAVTIGISAIKQAFQHGETGKATEDHGEGQSGASRSIRSAYARRAILSFFLRGPQWLSLLLRAEKLACLPLGTRGPPAIDVSRLAGAKRYASRKAPALGAVLAEAAPNRCVIGISAEISSRAAAIWTVSSAESRRDWFLRVLPVKILSPPGCSASACFVCVSRPGADLPEPDPTIPPHTPCAVDRRRPISPPFRDPTGSRTPTRRRISVPATIRSCGPTPPAQRLSPRQDHPPD